MPQLAWTLLEFAPLILFGNIGRFGGDLETRFLCGAATALLVVPLLRLLGRRQNPLLLGAAAWLILIALAYLIRFAPLGNLLLFLGESSFFLAVFFAGLTAMLLAPRAVFALDDPDPGRARRFSLLVLAAALLGLGCSILFRGQETYSAVLPSIVLFLLQSFLEKKLAAVG